MLTLLTLIYQETKMNFLQDILNQVAELLQPKASYINPVWTGMQF